MRQIRLMSRIYRSTAVVEAWLGDEDEHSKAVFNLVSQVTAYQKTRELADQPENNTSAANTSNGLETKAAQPNFVSHIEELSERPYWRRAWVRQEILLARKLTLHCGTAHVDWNSFSAVFMSSSKASQVTTVMRPIISYIQQTGDLEGSDRPLASLEENILTYGHADSSDIRDRIYTLLPISEDCQDPETALDADYGVSEYLLLLAVLNFCRPKNALALAWCLMNALAINIHWFNPGVGVCDSLINIDASQSITRKLAKDYLATFSVQLISQRDAGFESEEGLWKPVDNLFQYHPYGYLEWT